MPTIPTPRNENVTLARRLDRFDDIRIPKLKAWALKSKSEADILSSITPNTAALEQWQGRQNGFKCWRDDPLGIALVTALDMTADAMDAVWNSISTSN